MDIVIFLYVFINENKYKLSGKGWFDVKILSLVIKLVHF